MIKTILIDDEINCTDTLKYLLASYEKDIEIIGVFNNSKDGLKTILNTKPDLVFLDVEMPFMNGFDVLESLPSIDFKVVFTTAYDKYALQAIKFSALDYLLKPIDADELKKACEKIISSQKNITENARQYSQLFYNLKGDQNTYNKITIPSMEGLAFVTISDIIRCKADGNYTTIFLNNQKQIVSSRNLKEYENLLENVGFIRVHNSEVINLNHIKKYIKGDGGQVVMSDDSIVEVSRRRKEFFLSKL